MTNKPSVTVRDVEQFLSEHHGVSVDGVAPLEGGFWTAAFGYELCGRRLVFRVCDFASGFEADREAMAHARPGLQSGLLTGQAVECLAAARATVHRRNRLAHGTIHYRPTRVVPIKDLPHADLEIEWALFDRRSEEVERISMARLRKDVYDAIAAFSDLLAYGEWFVERAPEPTYFTGGQYLSRPTL